MQCHLGLGGRVKVSTGWRFMAADPALPLYEEPPLQRAVAFSAFVAAVTGADLGGKPLVDCQSPFLGLRSRIGTGQYV